MEQVPVPILDGGASAQGEGAVVPIPDASSLAITRGVHQAHTRSTQYATWDKQKVRAPIYVLDIMHVTDIAQDMHASLQEWFQASWNLSTWQT